MAAAQEEVPYIIDDSYMLQCNLDDMLHVKEEQQPPATEYMHDNESALLYIAEDNLNRDDVEDAYSKFIAMDNDSSVGCTSDEDDKIAMKDHTLELRHTPDGMQSYFCVECDKEFMTLEEITREHGYDEGEDIVKEQQWEAVADEEDLIENEAAEQPDGVLEQSDVDSSTELVGEVKAEQPELSDKYMCDICQQIFHDFESAEQHDCVELQPDDDFDMENEYKLEPNDADEHEEEQEEEPKIMPYILQYEQCDICQVSFSSLVALCEHRLRSHSDGSGLIRCDKCHRVLKTVYTLAHHIKHSCKFTANPAQKLAKKPVQPVTCGICNTQLGSEKSLKFHMRIHQARTKKSIQSVLPAGAELKYNELNQFFCEICNKSFDQNLLTVHKNMHQQQKHHVCAICNRQFENLSSYEMHLQLHASQDKQHERFPMRTEDANGKKLPYACQYCGRAFGRPYEKVKHERIHTGEKPYECEVCGKSFRVSYSLTMHLRTHTDIRPYVCPTCNARFKSKPVYAHHMRSHQNDRPYKCDICSKTYQTSVRLNAHRNSHRKPFTCTECNRPFASLYAVKMHMKTHSKSSKANENLKHRCQICGAEYARLFALSFHIKEAHQIDVEVGGGMSGEDVQKLDDEEGEHSEQQQGGSSMYEIITQQHDGAADCGEVAMQTVVSNEVVEHDESVEEEDDEDDEENEETNEVDVLMAAARNAEQAPSEQQQQQNNYAIYFLD